MLFCLFGVKIYEYTEDFVNLFKSMGIWRKDFITLIKMWAPDRMMYYWWGIFRVSMYEPKRGLSIDDKIWAFANSEEERRASQGHSVTHTHTYTYMRRKWKGRALSLSLCQCAGICVWVRSRIFESHYWRIVLLFWRTFIFSLVLGLLNWCWTTKIGFQR